MRVFRVEYVYPELDISSGSSALPKGDLKDD